MVAALGTPRTFVKFPLIGLSGVVVNLGSFHLLLELSVHKYLASPIAIEIVVRPYRRGAGVEASKWYDWWGGSTYGYRSIVDTAPFFALLVIPVIERVIANRRMRMLFGVLLLWSATVNSWVPIATI